tara:strand:+ start:10222 stop:17415 length:7194 start_codon:yes stop_codon:yes gene_type:complete
MNELEQIVQQMLDEGQPEENINAVIAEYQKSNPDSNVGKTNAVVEETVPAAAEKPVDMGLQSESGSLESPRKSVRKQTRQKELALIADNKQELINNLEEEYYKATSIEDISTKKKNLQQQLKNNFEQGEFKSNERELYEEYLQNPSVDLEIPDETLAEKMQEEFDAKERDFMEDVPEYAQQELKQQLGQRKEEQEASYAQSELEFTDNLNAYEEKVKAINISIDMGVNPTPEEVEELQLNLKDLKERSTDIIAKQSDLNKTKGIYDAFKRSYSDLDMLENTLAKTGIDIALGVNYTLDMLKSEEGKAKSYTKDLINLSQELAKNRQENLAKPVAIGAVSNISQFSEWAGDALINFVPSGIMAASGPAALPLFFTTGYTSRISEYAVNEAEAIKNLPKLKEQLENTTDQLEKNKITEQINKYNDVISTNNLTKLATSGIYGAAEGVFERLGTVKLINDLKAARKAIPVSSYKEAISKSAARLPGGTVIEGGTEGLTTLTQNIADIHIDGQEKSYTEGMDEAMAQGALIGTGFRVAEGGVVGRAAMLNVISSKQEKQDIANRLSEISELTLELKNENTTTDRKNQIGEIITKKIKSISENQDITSARFLRLSEEQQKQVFELDRQSRKINSNWTSAASDPSISEKSKDILRKELEQEFNSLQQQKRDLIDSADKRFKSLEAVEGLSEGDIYRNALTTQTNLQKVKVHNKKTKWANKVLGISNNDISKLNSFIEGESPAMTTDAGDTINKEEARVILENVAGNDGFFDKDSKNAVVFTDIAPKTNRAAAIHEYMHAAFLAKGLTKEAFDAVKDDLMLQVEMEQGEGNITNDQLNNIKAKLSLYETEDQSEELFTVISDLINQDIIREESKDFLSKLRDNIKSSINTFVNPNEADEFKINTGEQAFEFIKNFNRKIVSGKKINLGATSQPEDQKGVETSKIVENVAFEEGSVNNEFQNYKHDGKTNNAPESFQAEAAIAYEPLAQAVVDRISKVGLGISKEQDQFIMDYLADNQNKQDIVSDLTFGTERNKASSLLGLAKTYNPEVGSFGGYAKSQLANRAIRVLDERVGGQVTQGAQTLDTPESKEVVAEDQKTEITDTRNVFEKFNLPKELNDKSDKLAELATIKADKTLTGKNISDLKKVNSRNKAFNDLFSKQLFKDISEVLGKNTKTSEDFSKFIKKNIDDLKDIALSNIDFQKGGGPATDWNVIEPSNQEFLEYYEAKNDQASTRSDRKKSLNKAIARQIGNEKRIEYAKKDKATAKLFKEKHGVVLASKILPPKNGPTKLSNMAGFKDGAGRPAQNVTAALLEKFGGEYDLSTEKGQNELVGDLEKIGPTLPIEIIGSFSKIFPNHRMMKDAYKNSKKSKKGAQQFKKLKAQLKNKIENVVEEIKQKSKTKLEGKAEGWAARDFNKWLGSTPETIKKSIESGRLQNFNDSNSAMHKQVWEPLYEAIIQNPSAARLAVYLTPTSFGGAGWHRLGAEVIGYSQNPKGNGKKLYEWEHAMQANNARLFLISSALNKVPFQTAYPAVMNNYKVIALDAAADAVLKKANRGNSMGLGWDVYDSHWTERYFHPDVFIFGGIDPASIIDINGQTMADKYKIDAAGKSTRVMASKILDNEFNDILQKVKGVKSEARYSEDRAKLLGKNKGRFKFFVPYSAEDFVGLIYPTLGKGKVGDKNFEWYKKNLLTPYAVAINQFEAAKVNTLKEWRQLKKQIKKSPKSLKKQAVRGFTNEQALRIFLWNEQNVVPETTSKRDTKALVNYVENSPELLEFANSIKSLLNGDPYPAPESDWLAGNLTIDLINNINTVSRSEFLKDWQENVDTVYSKENLNKLQAIFGDKYVEALENILHRMKTGRNRIGGNRLEQEFLGWVNDSVGTIMFFNTRSALLQTISSVNFINFSDNNPLMAGKAFANQPQFWKDFATLMNSDFLKARRSGLKNDVNADEIANAASTSKNRIKGALSGLLKAGFLPTQIADNFAIAIGGASFYRNRINSYKKKGFSEQEAISKTLIEFQEIAEESQQSSRPDRVSMQQASNLGRVILAFANTPMQYTRLVKKASLDLYNGRGDWKTNLSKIIYYGAVQNIIFTALQQALFASLFDDDTIDDEEEEKAIQTIANSTADLFLRGSGVYGAGAAAIKNVVIKAVEQYKSKAPNYVDVGLEALSLTPPIDKKISNLRNAGRAFTYKDNLKDIRSKGISVDNPAALALGQVLSAVANVPADRAVLKARNIKMSLDQELETWQRIALALGYSDYNLDIDNDSQVERSKEFESFMKNLKKSNPDAYKRVMEARKKSPAKKLKKGVAGQANRDGTIEIDPNLSSVEKVKTVAHEKQHVKDMKSGVLDYDDKFVYWKGKKYKRKNGKILYNGKYYKEGDPKLPWEKRAYDAEPTTKQAKKLYA